MRYEMQGKTEKSKEKRGSKEKRRERKDLKNECSTEPSPRPLLVLLLRITIIPPQHRQHTLITASFTVSFPLLLCLQTLLLVLVPGEVSRGGRAGIRAHGYVGVLLFTDFQEVAERGGVVGGDMRGGRQGADGFFAGAGAESGAERPFDGFVDRFVEDVREERDDGETELE